MTWSPNCRTIFYRNCLQGKNQRSVTAIAFEVGHRKRVRTSVIFLSLSLSLFLSRLLSASLLIVNLVSWSVGRIPCRLNLTRLSSPPFPYSISHHSSLSVTLVTQFLFMKSKIMRLISANSHITTLYRSPRDQLSLRLLNSQIYPRSKGFLSWAHTDACAKPYSSLTIDCGPHSDDETRVRRSSFPDEDEIVIYQPEER